MDKKKLIHSSFIIFQCAIASYLILGNNGEIEKRS